jgi:uncharacterized protein (TIGR02302 family)
MTQKTSRETPPPRAVNGSAPLGRSRAVLLWERLEAAFWKPAALALGFGALAVTGFPAALGPWPQTALLALAAIAFLSLIADGVRRLKAPSLAESRRRIEQVNALDHRPLESLADRPSSDDPVALAVWEAHRARLQARLKALRVGPPRPQLAARDPRGLRIAAAFLLVLALAATGSRAPDNLIASVTPSFERAESRLAIGLDAWLAPPDYTGLPPQFLSRSSGRTGSDAPVGTAEAAGGNDPAATGLNASGGSSGPDHAVPDGTRLVVQVTGADGPAVLITPTGEKPLERFAENGVAIEHIIAADGEIRVEADGETLARWVLKTIPDQPPEVALPEAPGPSAQRALTIVHTVSDDYGVTELHAEIERADRPAGSAQPSPHGKEEMTLVTPLAVPDRSRYGQILRAYRDFTAHPWAGGTVRLTLVATDAKGQIGRSEPVEVVLPAREFTHPVAQLIADLRRELAWDPLRNFRPVRDALDALSWQHDEYGDDVTVFLALREAVRRLALGRGGMPPELARMAAVGDLLWKTALYLEDGGVSLALARLRAAERALAEALARGADQAELERLMDELQSAMRDYIEAMTDQLRERLAEGEDVPMFEGDPEQMLSGRDLDEMMNQMREMMRNGRNQDAQAMLEQMRRMMENLQAGMQPQMSPQDRQTMDMLDRMQELMDGQRELMDRTFRNQQGMQQPGQQGQQGQRGERGQRGEPRLGEGQPGQMRPGQPGQQGQGGQSGQTGPRNPDAVLQEALRRQLGELMRQYGEAMGEIPDPFGRADESMADSAERLGRGQNGQALESQGDAMDALRQAAEEARSAMMERFDRQMGMGQAQPGQGGQRTTDPFGRQPNQGVRGPMPGEVDVPDTGSLERAREIRDELRRRAGDPDRPAEELDYIRRLLDQFR